eukprot:CAMPEP_0196599174 /NCGR_PEP_ID=MMETSP1081-20130531/94720_1 /TAXON_ID=36882 /ORGANISM="Pyramimonas amylifera, Strain CCMP720" /LENGTH=149 /DNA_ID=CAMNT_0041924933 /DNA_START=61 /DNA_END=510 /DNA_ORIENTATION=-
MKKFSRPEEEEMAAVKSAFSLLSAVTTEKLQKLTKPQLIQVIGDLLAMLAKTGSERSSRFDQVVGKMLKKQTNHKQALQDKQKKRMEADKKWLAERRQHMEVMAGRCERDRAASAIQDFYRSVQFTLLWSLAVLSLVRKRFKYRNYQVL